MNKVVHFEIPAKKPEKVSEFYRKTFNWKIEKWDGPDDYWLINTGRGKSGIDGGITRAKKPFMLGSYYCTVEVENLKKMREKVKNNGGEVLTPIMPIPQMGWLSYCKDTEGNVFGMMQNDPNAK